MLDKEDIATAKEIATVLQASKSKELIVAGNLISVLLSEREQQQPAQKPWVGLTDEEIDYINYTTAYMLAREVEAKLKEKNSA